MIIQSLTASDTGVRSAAVAGCGGIKNKDAKEAAAFCDKKVVSGDEAAVKVLSEAGTVYPERSHSTARKFNARLTRKGSGMSEEFEIHRSDAARKDIYRNPCHEVRTLKAELNASEQTYTRSKFQKKRQHGTLVTATELTDHTRTVKELLYGIPVLSVS